MNVLGWIILAVYLVGWLGFSVTIARFMEKSTPSDDAAERSIVVVLGMLTALFWPLVIPGGWIYKKVFQSTPPKGGTP